MKNRTSTFLLLFGIILFSSSLLAQDSYTFSGYIKDQATGETLPFANVYLKSDPGQGTTTNVYGFYSLTLPAGEYTLVFSYLGYGDVERNLTLSADQRINIELSQGITMEDVVVTAEEKDANVESTEMGTVELPVEDIKTLPAIFGEVDILKALQLLPGVMSAGEGTSGFYVRGGGPDQNLVLLDEAVVYNSGHLLGFFSVFNSDALKNTTLIKGGMPAAYGGRISSVVDIQMKEGNDKSYSAEGGIGLIASRLTFQGPIVKDRSSFIISGRRTYGFDLAQPAIENTNFAGTNYFFYDLNTKVNYRFSDKDRLYLSGYFGRDVLNYQLNSRNIFFRLPYGNATATLRWNHLFNDKLFMNLSAIYNDYDFSFDGGQADFSFGVFSGVRDYNGKLDFDWYPNQRHNVRFGVNYTYHRLTPNVANAVSGDVEFSNDLQSKFAHEAAIYIQDDFKATDRLKLNIGLRASLFTQVGPYTSSITGEEFGNLEPVKTYGALEPRASAKLTLNPTTSIKAGFSYNPQYLHLVSNTSSTLPTDIWVPSSELVRPQDGIQAAIGYFRNFADNKFETSVEVYYRRMWNQLDYGESYVNSPTEEVELSFIRGDGRAYGLELFLRKNRGALTGWIGYTLSRSERIFEEINNGEPYPTRFDRTHDLSVVANYKLSDRWTFGGVFVYGTGNTFTPLRSVFLIDQQFVQEFGPRNSARIDPYHRLDLSATLTPRKAQIKNKAFRSSWTFSVYNVYNRFNTFFISYDVDANLDTGTASGVATKVALFPVIPSVTWNFKWNQKTKNNNGE
ncbi:MAG: TonB-dependent receptor [Bacteroidota bacterium]